MLDDLLGDAGKNLRVFGGELGENLSIKLNAGYFQLVYESGVGFMAVITESRVETHYPELAEVGLLVATVGEGIATSAHKRLMRGV